MKTPEQILQGEKYSSRFKLLNSIDKNRVISAMEEYADQFKTKICPCQQQEAELKEIKRVNKSL